MSDVFEPIVRAARLVVDGARRVHSANLVHRLEAGHDLEAKLRELNRLIDRQLTIGIPPVKPGCRYPDGQPGWERDVQDGLAELRASAHAVAEVAQRAPESPSQNRTRRSPEELRAE